MKSYNEMTWKEQKFDYMEWFFKEDYEKWSKMDVNDDRRVYINTYDQIQNAVNQLPDEPDVYIKAAMNNLMREDFDMMKRIQTHFATLESIGYYEFFKDFKK